MTTACWICLDPIGDPETVCGPHGSRYHARCLAPLFGSERLPRLPLRSDQVVEMARKMVGKQSISGAQPKLSLMLDEAGEELLAANLSSPSYILKPATDRYRHVPENEHVSMQLARRVGIVTEECGLVALADGALALLVRRFDRTMEKPPRKLQLEDFCSLAGMKKEHKYESSAEQCAELIRRYATDPDAAVKALFRLFVFSYWIGNGDLHLKNLSLLRELSGVYRLAPAYDLVNTVVLMGDDKLALPVQARIRDVRRSDWLAFAEDRLVLLPRDEAALMLDQMLATENEARALIERSALPLDHRQKYIRLIGKRSRALAAPRVASSD